VLASRGEVMRVRSQLVRALKAIVLELSLDSSYQTSLHELGTRAVVPTGDRTITLKWHLTPWKSSCAWWLKPSWGSLRYLPNSAAGACV